MGHNFEMRIQKVIRRRIRRAFEGGDFVGDVNAAISANVGEKSSSSSVSSRSNVSAQTGQRAEEEPGATTGEEKSPRP
jgi:hypothetical protein